MFRPFSAFLASTLALLAVAGVARAADGAVRVTVGGACDARAIREAVERQGGKVDDLAPIRLDARVERAEASLDVRVTGEHAGRAIHERRFAATTCEEAIEALALMAVVAAREDDAPVEADTPPLAAAITPRDVVEGAPPAAERPEPRPRRAGLVFDGWASPMYSSLGDGAFGARVGFGGRAARRFLSGADVSIGSTLPASVDGGGGRGRFAWTTARLGVTPARVGLDAHREVSAELLVEAGMLDARGSGVARPESSLRVWAAAGGGARARWEVSGSWFVDARAAVLFPLVRDEFYFRDVPGGGTVYAVPVAALDTGLGVGRTIP